MTWAQQEKLAYLMRLPWTFIVEDGDEPGERILRIAEVPGASASGSEPKVVEADLWDALRVMLEARLMHNDPLPRPAGTKLPWEDPSAIHRPVHRRVMQTVKDLGEASETEPMVPTVSAC